MDMAHMKLARISICGLLGAIIGLISWERWDEPKNHGLSWGYWGEFNNVSNALAQIPGVTVSQAWYNADFLTLEEFGFVINSGGRSWRIGFEEKDPIRRLSGNQLQLALGLLVNEMRSHQHPQATPQ